MPDKLLSTAQVLDLLAQTPPRLTTLTAGLPSDQLHTAPHPGEWSANEVLAHVRACADVWGKAIETILNQDKPTLRAVNPRTWIKQTGYLDQAFQLSLDAFASQRTALLTVLKSLSPEMWSRSAIVKGAGKPLERTVLSYAQWLATHERPHVKQIERIVNTLRME
ncbi:MAG: DinB family protein [Anaerolineae bacterium]|nr:DinB family protein [Anaerolineae bacterium]